jgi:folate-binding protein YgfZ
MLNTVGKIQSDVDVVGTPGGLLVGVAPGTGQELAMALERMLIMEDAELHPASADWAWIAAHGPRSQDLARAVACKMAGVAFGRIDWTLLGGSALVAPRSEYQASLLAASLEGNGWAKLASPSDWQVLRLETGYPEFGTDYGSNQTPHEASLERRAVAWNKGCYLGQEVVCKQDLRGKARWRLAPIVIDSANPPPVGTPVRSCRETELVGGVTSSAFSSHLGRSVAMARLKSGFTTEGLKLEVDAHSAMVKAYPLGA